MSKNLVDFRENIVYNNYVAGVSHIGKMKNSRTCGCFAIPTMGGGEKGCLKYE